MYERKITLHTHIKKWWKAKLISLYSFKKIKTQLTALKYLFKQFNFLNSLTFDT